MTKGVRAQIDIPRGHVIGQREITDEVVRQVERCEVWHAPGEIQRDALELIRR